MKKYDVVIAGGGPAGIAAALYAAKNGAKTLLLEKSGFAGGMSTDGQLNVFCGSASGGLYREILERLTVKKGTHTVYDAEELKQFYFEKLKASGVDLLFHTVFDSAEIGGGKIGGILARSGLGHDEIEARFYIDATGDGVLAASAGCSFWFGREEDGKMQPCSLLVRIGGVDDAEAVYPIFRTYPEYQAMLKQAVQAGEVPAPAGHLIIIPEKHPGIVNLNMTNCTGINGADPWDRSRAEMICRSQVKPLLEFMKKNLPGYRNAYVLQTAQYTGIRESRHFRGEYLLSEADIKNAVVFDDWCATRLKYRFGIHNLNGSGVDNTDRPASGEYTLPYRSLLPKGADNLLLAGRCISGTHLAHSSFRVMPICMATGQAAGTAAALAAKQGCELRELDIRLLQETLASQGMERPE